MMMNGEPETESKDGDRESRDEPGAGALLKSEREKKGLTLDQIAQTTKLRRHFLEALEKEEWDLLPAPIFIKGFLRSYALAVGLDENRVYKLYERSRPAKQAPPQPLVENGKSRKGGLIVLLLVLVAAAVIIFLFRWGSEQTPDLKDTVIPSEEQEKTGDQAEPSTQESAGVSSTDEGHAGGTEPKIPVVEDDPEAVEKKPAEEEKEEALLDETASEEPVQEPVADVNLLILKGIITEKTWIKIYIDDQKPKEYIFQPGSSPQWEAKEGFYVLVGNAAGVEFDFNGNRIGDLGKLAQVVRLRFPEDFEARYTEE